LGEAFALLFALELTLELALVLALVLSSALPFFFATAPAPPGFAAGDEAPLRFFLDGFSVASEVTLINVPESSLVLMGIEASAIGMWAGHLECLHAKYAMQPAEPFLSQVSPQKHDGTECGVFPAVSLEAGFRESPAVAPAASGPSPSFVELTDLAGWGSLIKVPSPGRLKSSMTSLAIAAMVGALSRISSCPHHGRFVMPPSYLGDRSFHVLCDRRSKVPVETR